MKIPPFLKLLLRQVILFWDPKVHHEKIFHDQLTGRCNFLQGQICLDVVLNDSSNSTEALSLPTLSQNLIRFKFNRTISDQFRIHTKECMICSVAKKYYPINTLLKLNIHKTFRRRPGYLLNVLYTFNLRPRSGG